MSSAGLSCELWVAGSRFVDTGADYRGGVPTALSGLSVTWGRSTNIDQPDTSTCSFTVADKDGDADFRGRLHVGQPVLVYAAGGITAGEPTDVAVDGDFETSITNRTYPYLGAVTPASITYSGAQALKLAPYGGTGGPPAQMTLWLPPAAFNDSDITAWDAIPQVSPGDTWTVTVAVRLGYGQNATMAFATFPNPSAGPGVERGGRLITIDTDIPLTWQEASISWTAPDGLGVAWGGAEFILTLARWADTPGTWAATPGSWDDWGTARVDLLRLMAPDRAVKRVLVFSGRITDLNTAWAGDRLEVACIAADWTADLANDVINHNWAGVDTITDRVDSILGLATKTFEADVDSGVGSRQVSRVKVSGATVLGLLTDLATSGDGVLWPAFHETRPFYLWYENPAGRVALVHLYMDTDGLVKIEPRTRPVGAVTLSACDLGSDAVAFTQTSADIITRIDVSWLDQSGTPDPVETHERVVDTVREASWGQRGTSFSTLLISDTTALDVANRVLNRSDELGWHATGLVWDSMLPTDFDDSDRNTLLTLLDGTQRPGCALVVHDLPAWAPGTPILGCYLEGGTYSYENSRWTLSMNISPSGETGAAVHWNELDPGWAWNEFDPSIHWLDLYGVKGP